MKKGAEKKKEMVDHLLQGDVPTINNTITWLQIEKLKRESSVEGKKGWCHRGGAPIGRKSSSVRASEIFEGDGARKNSQPSGDF